MRKTYGVAITIPAPHGALLQAARDRAGDPLAPAIPPHITLLPPTVIHREELSGFGRHLAQIARAQEPFDIELSGTGTFRPVSPVVFVQVSRGIAQCEILEQAVRSGPVNRDLEFNYHPHVTIAHHVPDGSLDGAFADLADFRAGFAVTSIDLYRHHDDEIWRPVQSFTLGAGAGDSEVDR